MKTKKKFDPEKVDIAQAVRLLRHELGEISQHELALRLGIQTAMISHWETRVQRVSHKNLWKMAKMAAVPLCWVFLKADGISQSDIIAILDRQMAAEERSSRSKAKVREIKSVRSGLAKRAASRS